MLPLGEAAVVDPVFISSDPLLEAVVVIMFTFPLGKEDSLCPVSHATSPPALVIPCPLPIIIFPPELPAPV